MFSQTLTSLVLCSRHDCNPISNRVHSHLWLSTETAAEVSSLAVFLSVECDPLVGMIIKLMRID